MQSTAWNQENYLNKISQHAKQLDYISLFQTIDYFRENGFDIFFKSQHQVTFSPVLVEKIEIENPNKINIFLNFSGFFGYHAALYDYLLERSIHEGNKSLLDFLNLFYNRIFQILFKSKRILYPFYEMNSYLKVFSSLSGLAENYNSNYLDYNSFFISKYKSRANFEKLLSQFTKMKVKVEEFIGDYLYFDKSFQVKLGKGYCLNAEGSIGIKSWSEDAKIKIIFYPKNSYDWLLFTAKENTNTLVRLIDNFLNKRLGYDVFILPEKTKQSKLGNGTTLGLNTFLCRKEDVNKCYMFKFMSG